MLRALRHALRSARLRVPVRPFTAGIAALPPTAREALGTDVSAKEAVAYNRSRVATATAVALYRSGYTLPMRGLDLDDTVHALAFPYSVPSPKDPRRHPCRPRRPGRRLHRQRHSLTSLSALTRGPPRPGGPRRKETRCSWSYPTPLTDWSPPPGPLTTSRPAPQRHPHRPGLRLEQRDRGVHPPDRQQPRGRGTHRRRPARTGPLRLLLLHAAAHRLTGAPPRPGRLSHGQRGYRALRGPGRASREARGAPRGILFLDRLLLGREGP